MSVIIEDQIKGHEKVKAQISQAFKEKRLPHALLFSGPSGAGKRKMAWALAQKLLCEEERPPCGRCYQCRSAAKAENENILSLSRETLQFRLQDVKGLPHFLSLQSFAKAKVILIDEAEKLNLQAGNFLLKLIEEPPEKSFFFLISSAPSRLPLTIRSRLQNLRFQALPDRLAAEISPPDTPEWMIRGCRGQMDLLEELRARGEARDAAFSLLSEALANSFSVLRLDFTGKIKNRKEALSAAGFWQQILRDARFLKLGRRESLIHGDKIEDLERLSQFSEQALDAFIQKSFELEKDLQANVDYILCFENFVISLKQALAAPAAL